MPGLKRIGDNLASFGAWLMTFGALGLFPTYFALSQEVSSEHQGKVTGTLGLFAHGSLALIYPVQGLLADYFKSPAPVLAGVGVVPMLALGALLVMWRLPRTAGVT